MQLDSDHFGLEKIKKRLIEYLAVVRLKELNAEREAAIERRAAEIDAKVALEDKKESDEQQGKELSVYNKDQTLQTPQVPSPAPFRANRKDVKGPILL